MIRISQIHPYLLLAVLLSESSIRIGGSLLYLDMHDISHRSAVDVEPTFLSHVRRVGISYKAKHELSKIINLNLSSLPQILLHTLGPVLPYVVGCPSCLSYLGAG